MGQTTIRRKSWASWFPIERDVVAIVMTEERIYTYGHGTTESCGWPHKIAANRKRWGMKP